MQQETRKASIDMFNLGSLEPAKQEEMVVKLGELIFESALARAFVAMDDADQAELNEKMNTDIDPTEFMTLVQQKVPNFQEIVLEELTELKKQADIVTSA